MYTNIDKSHTPGRPGPVFGTLLPSKRLLWRSIIAALLLMSLAHTAGAATYYLDSVNGNDTNTGTSANAAWQSMSKVQASTQQGDTVNILSVNDSVFAVDWPEGLVYSSTGITQFGFTWTFDKSYRIGRFANGDFWAVGPVSVVAIAPACVATSDSVRNGSMINPVSNTAQGFDSRAIGWSPSNNVGAGVSQATPVVVAAGSSLISTQSHEEKSDGSWIQSAAVLTVLASAPAEGSFRPPYFGTDKTINHDVTMLDYTKLASLPRGPVSSVPTLSSVERKFQRPWISFLRGGPGGRNIHPTWNMAPYGREMSRDIGIGALMLQLDFTNEQKERLLISFVQMGIDYYGVSGHPNGRDTWNPNGGHNQGRKFPILFAGLVLDDEGMLGIGEKSGDYIYSQKPGGGFYGPANLPPDYIWFQEDMQTFYVDQQMVNMTLRTGVTGYALGAGQDTITIGGLPKWDGSPLHQNVEITSGPGAGQMRYIVNSDYDRYTGDVTTVTVGEPWDVIPVTGQSQYRLHGYETGQIGLPEWGINYATSPDRGAPSWHADYRWINGVSWPGWVLAARLTGLKERWNHEALFDYIDRWMYNSAAEGPFPRANPTYDSFTTNMWNTYRGDYAIIWSTDSSGNTTTTIGDLTAAGSPQITSIGGRTTSSGTRLSFSVAENAALNLSVTASDPNNDPITYSASNLPSGASFASQDFTWTPTYDQAGTYQITFGASDGENQDTETVMITVSNVNRGPSLSTIGDQSVDEQSLLAFTVSANDLDGDTVQYAASGLPSGATFSGSSFRWTPTPDQVGAYDVTFVASDGQLQDTETVTLYVMGTGTDTTAPTVTGFDPKPGAIQVALNNLVTLRVADAGHGVNPESVVIEVNGSIVYQGDVDVYNSDSGQCTRAGNWASYRYIYQPDDTFGFDQIVTVVVTATDQAGNTLNGHPYTFSTEMRAFGSNEIVGGEVGPQSHPVTVGDANGNIWAAWHAGPAGSRDIYVARKVAQANSFDAAIRLTTDAGDQCNPDIALGADGQLYLVWQDDSRGNWDLHLATSSNGTTWSRPTQVTDSDDNETNPAIAVSIQSPARAYVAWQDDRSGNADVYVASSTNAFVDSEVSAVTTNSADQYDPDIAVDGMDTAYVIWTDLRNQRADIYGAASGGSAWTNVAVVTTSSNQVHPALAADPATSTLHLAWEDDAPGHSDIYYAMCEGLPVSPVTGSTIIDDTTGADQFAPTIVCSDSTHVFAAWQDMRHSNDTDLFVTELGSGAAKTNVLVGDNGANTDQDEPALGIDGYANPYLVWTDSRNTGTEVYYAATTFVDPTPLDSKMVVASAGAIIGPAPATIDEPDDVSITVPAGACQCDVRITISEILNPQAMPAECLGSYDFGPSGIDFDEPVTVTIPYRFAGSGNAAKPYWYDSLTGALSQQGITDIESIVVANDLYALRFKTTHFTPFYLMAAEVETSDGADISGGCSVSATSDGSPRELLLPYGLLALAMLALRYRDKKRRCNLQGNMR